MAIETKILGNPGEDNATLLQIDSGSSVELLLFDCGENCLDNLSVSAVQSIDHLFFSHFHMDHVCGFDRFFRLNYNRPEKPVVIWGPPGTIEVIHHRLCGVTWNLHHDQPGVWLVNEIDSGQVRTSRFLTRDAFHSGDVETPVPFNNGLFLEETNFSVSAKFLNHGTIPSLAYRVDEPVRENIDPAQLEASGLPPGPWIRDLKERTGDEGKIEVDGKIYPVKELKKSLLTESSGCSAAYLTDFIVNPGSEEWRDICDWLGGVDTLICEAQFRESDNVLAETHAHMTTKRVGQLAADAGAGELIIQHISRRYDESEWNEMLAEARSIFPQTKFPLSWKLNR
ncbi:MAG: MBL fold metallo-hydrolase [Verrucomicrobiales bacterium]|nr:MBL fold metallo-hydrolase [Verrucomicrobiales bacterium]